MIDFPKPKTYIEAEYIWIDSKGQVRSKNRTIQSDSKFPLWTFDGSSTGQATVESSEIILKPIYSTYDPFSDKGIYVLCECLDVKLLPIVTNKYHNAKKIFDKFSKEKIMFGLEQEYVIYDCKTKKPIGWPISGTPPKQGPYYCGLVSGSNSGRKIARKHYKACIQADLAISGYNREVMPGQWEFQIGPVIGIEASHQLILARYILERIAEEYDCYISYNPKPEGDKWNGSGCHINFSTADMRNSTTFKKTVKMCVEKLTKTHDHLMSCYGTNKYRMTGTHETSDPSKFTWGICDRSVSMRIPILVSKNGYGYCEDRRPASDINPYLATSELTKAICE